MPRFVTAFIEQRVFGKLTSFRADAWRANYGAIAHRRDSGLRNAPSRNHDVWRLSVSPCTVECYEPERPTVMSKKPSQSLSDQLKPFVAPFRFDGSGKFHLRSHKTNAKGGLDRDKAEKILEANRKRLNDFQERLYAQDRWSLLVIFQGMDAARQGQRHQEHLRRRQSAGLRSLFVQAADIPRARPRLHVAQHDCAAGARPHRHLQSLLLRGMSGDAGAPGIARSGENPAIS